MQNVAISITANLNQKWDVLNHWKTYRYEKIAKLNNESVFCGGEHQERTTQHVRRNKIEKDTLYIKITSVNILETVMILKIVRNTELMKL